MNDRTSAPSSTRPTTPGARPVRALFAALAVLLLGSVPVWGPIASARAVEWIVLCTGYSPCNAAGYSDSGYGAASGKSYWSQYTGHNCTNYVAYRLVRNGLPNTKPSNLTGNASNWGPSFPNQTNDSPAVGAIAWWDTSFSSSGHVAYVEKVVSATEILVSEDNWGGDFHWRKVTQGGGLWPKGFIHLKDQGASVAPATRTWQVARPSRLLDTQTGVGAPAGMVAAGGSVAFQVAGRDGLPSTGVGAVVLNVNATSPASSGYLTLFASRTTQPASRNVSFAAGGVTTESVLTRVGSDGKVRIYSSAKTHLSADIVGWSPSGGYVSGGAPVRVLDTRSGLAAPKAKLAAGGTLNLVVTGKAGIPTSGAQAAILEVSATGADAKGWLTAWQAGTSRPSTQHVRYEVGRPSTGLVVAHIGTGGAVSINASATTNVMVDVVGWLPTTADQVALRPVRVLDSQSGLGITQGRVAAGSTPSVPILGHGGVPTSGVQSVILTVTSYSPAAAGYLTAFPNGQSEPAYASVKYAGGQSVVNTVVVPVGSNGAVRVKTSASTYLKVAIQGYIRS